MTAVNIIKSLAREPNRVFVAIWAKTNKYCKLERRKTVSDITYLTLVKQLQLWEANKITD